MAHKMSAVGIFAREVEEVDACEDDEEAAEEGNGIYGVGRVEALEKDEGCEEREGRECDVVEWIDNIRRKLAERLIKVVHLRQNADHHNNHEHISARMRELVITTKRQLNSNAEGLDCHDRHATDGAANRQVDHRVLLAIFWCDFVDHNCGEDGDYQAVEHETWLHG